MSQPWLQGLIHFNKEYNSPGQPSVSSYLNHVAEERWLILSQYEDPTLKISAVRKKRLPQIGAINCNKTRRVIHLQMTTADQPVLCFVAWLPRETHVGSLVCIPVSWLGFAGSKFILPCTEFMSLSDILPWVCFFELLFGLDPGVGRPFATSKDSVTNRHWRRISFWDTK